MNDGERLFMVNSNPDDNLEDADNDDDDDDRKRNIDIQLTQRCMCVHGSAQNGNLSHSPNR